MTDRTTTLEHLASYSLEALENMLAREEDRAPTDASIRRAAAIYAAHDRKLNIHLLQLWGDLGVNTVATGDLRRNLARLGNRRPTSGIDADTADALHDIITDELARRTKTAEPTGTAIQLSLGESIELVTTGQDAGRFRIRLEQHSSGHPMLAVQAYTDGDGEQAWRTVAGVMTHLGGLTGARA